MSIYNKYAFKCYFLSAKNKTGVVQECIGKQYNGKTLFLIKPSGVTSQETLYNYVFHWTPSAAFVCLYIFQCFLRFISISALKYFSVRVHFLEGKDTSLGYANAFPIDLTEIKMQYLRMNAFGRNPSPLALVGRPAHVCCLCMFLPVAGCFIIPHELFQFVFLFQILRCV